MRSMLAHILLAIALIFLAAPASLAQCPASVPVEGTAPTVHHRHVRYALEHQHIEPCILAADSE